MGGRLGVGVLLLLALLWYASPQPDDKGVVTYPHASLINPILGGLGALLLIYAAIRQARTATEQAETARKQAQTASDRHEAQTEADRQRRITESYSKATEQLGSDKIAVRLGGIYTLERISRESPDDYWTVMETLCAFVREQARWVSGPAREPPTDIAAVLAVILRRREIERERRECWGLDLRGVDLRGGADLEGVHLERAYLWAAHLEGASMKHAHLEGANLEGANLEGANLSGAIGNAKTRLPDGFPRPAHWPPYERPPS